jgi:hypothetical protein
VTTVAQGTATVNAVNIFWGIVIALAAVAVSVASILFIRRRAPEGGYFADGDRAAGFFGVLSTGFSILLGFIVFLSFASYDESRSGAEAEATTLGQQFETAQFFDKDTAGQLGGQLICYGRYVVNEEWPQMRSGDLGDQVNPWGIAMYRTIVTTEPNTNAQGSAYDKWLDQTSDREQARLDRVHGAEGIIPWPLWVVLILSAVLVFVFVMFFADPAERAVVQGLQVGSVVLIMVMLLMVVRFLDRPYQEGVGGVQPTAMERTLHILENELAGEGVRTPLPCNADGQAK